MKIKLENIKYLSIYSSRGNKLLVLDFNNYVEVEKKLKSTFLGYLFFINFRSLGKNKIVCRLSILDIQEAKLKKELMKVIPKEKLFFLGFSLLNIFIIFAL